VATAEEDRLNSRRRVLINAQIAVGYALTSRLRYDYVFLCLIAYGCPKNDLAINLIVRSV
jgi:hypothetical protein